MLLTAVLFCFVVTAQSQDPDPEGVVVTEFFTELLNKHVPEEFDNLHIADSYVIKGFTTDQVKTDKGKIQIFMNDGTLNGLRQGLKISYPGCPGPERHADGSMTIRCSLNTYGVRYHSSGRCTVKGKSMEISESWTHFAHNPVNVSIEITKSNTATIKSVDSSALTAVTNYIVEDWKIFSMEVVQQVQSVVSPKLLPQVHKAIQANFVTALQKALKSITIPKF